MNNLPPVTQVAKAFSQAAATYDGAAILQTQVADTLAQKFMPACAGHVMDFGCGTGYLCKSLLANPRVSRITGVDVAPAMIQLAQQRWQHKTIAWQIADGQTMTIAPTTYDAIVSSLAIQWCADLNALFSNFACGLKPQGKLFLSTLGPDSMVELRQAWQQVDNFQHVNTFTDLASIKAALTPEFDNIVVTTDTICLTFATVLDLTNNLKQLGVNNRNAKARRGLTTVGQFRAMQSAYETFRNDQGQLPLTYQVIYLQAQKRA